MSFWKKFLYRLPVTPGELLPRSRNLAMRALLAKSECQAKRDELSDPMSEPILERNSMR